MKPTQTTDHATAPTDANVSLAKPQVVRAGDIIDLVEPCTQVDKAIIVCHGMGQQVKFETLNTVAQMLTQAAKDAGQVATLPPTVRLVKIGSEVLPRVELTLTNADGDLRTVHLYESYWAPVTEGQVTLTDTIRFLLQAGGRGIRYALRGKFIRARGSDPTTRPKRGIRYALWGKFTRYLFGRQTHLKVAGGTTRYIAAIYLAVFSLVSYYFAFFAALISVALSCLLPLTLHPDVYQGWLLGVAGAPVVAFVGLSLWLGWWLATRGRRRRRDAADEVKEAAARPDMRAGASKTARRRGRALLGETILVLCLGLLPFVLAAGGLLWVLWRQLANRTPFLTFGTDPTSSPQPFLVSMAIVFWVAMYQVMRVARRTVVQYVGDVAAYISPFAVSKFAVIRNRIQDIGLKVAVAVYRARTHPAPAPTPGGGEAAEPIPAPADFLYREVIMVGHSLGSVVAYDTLNAMINEDLIPRADLRVVERTSMLLTFGSPLDKTAFIFRTQAAADADVREALAAAVQPLIANYDHRPARWVNVYSPADIISGALQYYDVPPGDEPLNGTPPTHPKRVENLVDPQADVPLLAHNQYWKNPVLRQTLYEALWTVPPAAAGPPPL